MRKTFLFHKLQVWHLSKDLVIVVYKLTKNFPAEEKFGLVSQLNRASISVASNIAEGSGLLPSVFIETCENMAKGRRQKAKVKREGRSLFIGIVFMMLSCPNFVLMFFIIKSPNLQISKSSNWLIFKLSISS